MKKKTINKKEMTSRDVNPMEKKRKGRTGAATATELFRRLWTVIQPLDWTTLCLSW